jgi:hypothetical protein
MTITESVGKKHSGGGISRLDHHSAHVAQRAIRLVASSTHPTQVQGRINDWAKGAPPARAILTRGTGPTTSQSSGGVGIYTSYNRFVRLLRHSGCL